jgi:hypothetical protein
MKTVDKEAVLACVARWLDKQQDPDRGPERLILDFSLGWDNDMRRILDIRAEKSIMIGTFGKKESNG